MAIVLKGQNITNMYTPIELITTNIGYAGAGGGITDHGMLAGLTHNDHPQYLLTANSSVFMTSANMTNYQLIANSSLSLGTIATVSFLHTSLSTNLVHRTNSTLFALTNHTHSNYITTGALSDHSHGDISTVSTAGTNLTLGSASSGLTVAVPAYLTTAYGAAIQGSGAQSQNTGTIVFANSNGVTFGLSDDGVMTASIPAIGGAQTGISSIYDGVSSSITAGALSFANTNGMSFGLDGSTMTGSYTVPGVTVFSNSNNVEFGLAGSTVTALANLSQTLQTSNVHNLTLSGNTSGTLTQVSSGTVTLIGGSNITLSQSGNKIEINAEAGGHDLIIGGQTAGTVTQIASGTLTLAGGNNITLSQDGSAITISGAAQGGVQTGISGIGVSNTTYTSGSVIWSGANNITVSSYVNGASQYVRLSVGNYITTGAASNHTHGSNVSTVSTAGVDMKFTSASNLLTAAIPAYLTTAMQSASSSVFAKTGFTTVSTAGSGLVGTLNTNGLNIGVPKYLTTAMLSNATHEHTDYVGLATTAITGASATVASDQLQINIPQGSIYYVDGGGITFGASSDGLSTTITATVNTVSASGGLVGTSFSTSAISGSTLGGAMNGAGITLSVPAWVTAGGGGGGNWSVATTNGSAISISTGAATNTLIHGNFVTTVPSGSVYFTEGSNVTWGSSVNGISTSVYLTAGGGTGGVGGGVAIGDGVNTITNGTARFSNANGVSWGVNGSTVTADIGSTQYFQASNTGSVIFTQMSNSPAYTWSSSANSNSTYMWLIT